MPEAAAVDRVAALEQQRRFSEVLLPAEGAFALFELKPVERHTWAADRDELLTLAAGRIGRPWQYVALAAFNAKHRTQAHARALRCFWADLDCGGDKHKRSPAGTYPTQRAGGAALIEFAAATGFEPSVVVDSGAGLHVYWSISEELAVAEWRPLAVALKEYLKAHGLRGDPAVATDAARVLRLPGGIHANGRPVRAVKFTGAVYSAEALRERFGMSVAAAVAAPAALLDVNSALDTRGDPFPPTAENAAALISALAAIAASANAAGAYPRDRWLRHVLALASLDVMHGWAGRGAELALTHSRGTPKYAGEADVRRVLDSYEPNRAGGVGIGTVLHDAAALGWVRPAPPAGGAGAGAADDPWVTEMNRRHALVRIGGDVYVLDRKTPIDTPAGIVFTQGFLKIGAFKAMLRGRAVQQAGRAVPVADAWLSHPARAQFEGASLSPDRPLPPTILNLWTGFAYESVGGDVTPWLDLAEALIPDTATRDYVLRWCAWKVQNPGSVPGTVLLATGVHGSGKNSFFEVVAHLFGQHGRVLGTAAQAVGQFNGHLANTLFCVMDEAHFANDPREADRLKAMVTSVSTTFESKGKDAVAGVNRAGFVLLTNHVHAWAASVTERRAVVVETGAARREDWSFWNRYHSWANSASGRAALMAYLRELDLATFDVRRIPKNDALARQIAMTATRDGVVSWWRDCLAEGEIRWRAGGLGGSVLLPDNEEAAIEQPNLRASFLDSGRRRDGEWAAAMKRLRTWHSVGTRRLAGSDRRRELTLPPLLIMREQFSAATGVAIDDAGAG